MFLYLISNFKIIHIYRNKIKFDKLDGLELTIKAIEEVNLMYDSVDIDELYQTNDINAIKILSMTQQEFAALLSECVGKYCFQQYQSIKIHRAIKQFLNISQINRLDINISKAIIYLAPKNKLFCGKNLNIDTEKINKAFENYDASAILDIGKKKFIRIMYQCDVKMGHATKIWNYIKNYIEDSQLQIPFEIIDTKFNNTNIIIINFIVYGYIRNINKLFLIKNKNIYSGVPDDVTKIILLYCKCYFYIPKFNKTNCEKYLQFDNNNLTITKNLCNNK